MAGVWDFFRISRTVFLRFSLSEASRFENGSSRRTSDGDGASARASATRCCWPPESWCGYLFWCSVRLVVFRISCVLVLRCFLGRLWSP